jgi:hypothetical protein
MGYDFKLPNISDPTESGKIEQIRSYLYQFIGQLEWALNSINNQILKDTENKKQEANLVRTVNSIKINDYSNEDFDKLLYKTEYYIGLTRPSLSSCSNYPIDEIGMLEVVSAMKQKSASEWSGFAYQTYRTETGNVYIRTYCSSSGWTAWKEVTLS